MEAEATGDRRRPDSLRAGGVSRSFEGIQALADVDLELRPDEIVGLIGPNGAGKTTLVNILTGFDLPSSGRVELGGTDITRWPPHRRGRAGLARTFQHGAPLPRAHGARERRGRRARREGVARARRGGARPSCSACSGSPRAPTTTRPCSRTATSGGWASRGRSRLRPRFVLMDEPAAGLHEAEMPAFAEVVRTVRDAFGAGVLLIDHNVALIMAVCDRVHVLDRGRTLAEGTPAEIRGNADVATAYLGAGIVGGGVDA